MGEYKMSILIKTKPQQPATSLQEKQNGFKFKMPTVQAKTNKVPVPIVDERKATSSTSLIGAGQRNEQTAAQTNKPDANKLLIDKPKPANLIATKPAAKSTPIPEMSADKYEVVANSVPEFSEAAGNKFEEQIGMLQQAIDGTGELKDQMVNILTFLDDNPQYKNNVSPKDVAVFVAGCRKVAGITVQEKTTRKAGKKKTTAKVEEVINDLADLEFTL